MSSQEVVQDNDKIILLSRITRPLYISCQKVVSEEGETIQRRRTGNCSRKYGRLIPSVKSPIVKKVFT